MTITFTYEPFAIIAFTICLGVFLGILAASFVEKN